MDQELITLLKPLYKNETTRILEELKQYLSHIKKVKLIQPDYGWYKFIDMYSVYADSVILDAKKNPFENMTLHLQNIRNLGCNAMHLLPFLSSPMKDAGFDISNFYTPREDLGTLDDLQKVVKRANELQIRMFMDLVFNHISEEHDWFKKAESGDEKYRNYFLHLKDKPQFIRTYEQGSAVWAEYQVNGERIAVNIAFPDRMSDIPHFRQGKDGHWYYHTYYPEELDLNWFNPDVFIEMAKILMFWASRGFNFRLDAVPFIGKGIFKDARYSDVHTHQIVAALRKIAVDINPECVILVETYEDLKSVIQYFGNSNHIEANLAYNFYLNTATWVSIVKRDVKYIWDKLNKIDETPKHAEWLNFLRNHDELSLAYLSDDLNNQIRKVLLPQGKSFRRQYGIAGRTYSFLKYNQKRYIMAYFLLMSFPGGIMIPYGDEIGKKNVSWENLKDYQRGDTRSINRGFVTRQEYQSPKSKKIFTLLGELFLKRQELRTYLNVWPERIPVDKKIFATRYRLGTSELKIFVNLSGTKQLLETDTTDYTRIMGINRSKVSDGLVELDPYAGIWLQK